MRISGFLAGVLLVIAAVLTVGKGRVPDMAGVLQPWSLPDAGAPEAPVPPIPTREVTDRPVAVTRLLSPEGSRALPPAGAADMAAEPGEASTAVPAGPAVDADASADFSEVPMAGQTEATPDPGIGEQEVSPTDVAVAAATADRWEAFFTPFRSEASAQGFASFLQTETGREFVVRRVGPGNYRVWFSMGPGENRPERMAEIEAVTGMALSGGRL